MGILGRQEDTYAVVGRPSNLVMIDFNCHEGKWNYVMVMVYNVSRTSVMKSYVHRKTGIERSDQFHCTCTYLLPILGDQFELTQFTT
jgi:hypothetical protein